MRKYEDFTEADRINSARNGRFCQTEWFKIYNWLVYDRQQREIFCDCCTKHATSAAIDVYKFEIGSGLRNWKKGIEKLLAHSQNFEYRMASRRNAKDEARTFIPVAA